MNNRSVFIRNFIISLFGFIWPTILIIVTLPFIIRGLGQEGYGIYTLVTTVIGYFSIFNSLQSGGIKYIAEYIAIGDINHFYQTITATFIFNLCIALIGTIILFILAPFFINNIFHVSSVLYDESVLAFRISAIGFFVMAIGWWGATILAGFQRYDWQAFAAILMVSIGNLGALLEIKIGGGLIGVTLASFIGQIISFIILMIGAYRLLPGKPRIAKPDKEVNRRIFSFGFYSIVHSIFGLVATQMDRLLLGYNFGVSLVAIYNVPYSIASRIHQMSAKGLETIFPLFSQMEAKKQTELIKYVFIRAQNINNVLVIASVAPLIALAREILYYWISPEFSHQGSLVFRLLICAYAVLASNVVCHYATAGIGHPQANTGFAFFYGVANVIGYLIFIPMYGLEGAGIANLLGVLVSVTIFVIFINIRYLKISYLDILTGSFIRPIASGVITILILYLNRSRIESLAGLLIFIICGEIIFFITSILFGVWQKEEIYFVIRLLKSFRKPQVELS